ncbi:MAG TPA: DUF3179 domain-containing (seleno)protein [Chthoniobacteraceae bacterium]|nr:DUF3179 domain-containing (seleno)protein [Chthoniobacteraceae bacterium]
MTKLFYSGLAGLALFEVLKVYLIMPLPGSQRFGSLDAAYFLHAQRWFFRIPLLLMIAAGSASAFHASFKRWPVAAALATIAIVWVFNFQMTAESMFKQPRTLAFQHKADNKLDEGATVIGVAYNGEAKAYPIRFLVYHHQVRDTIAGKPVMVTYCSVCRTGRVFEPIVNGHPEKFRLVGMDHFNAMFEDSSTRSWWQQSTGEAVAGKLKGATLPEVECVQVSVSKWFELHPNGLVMQTDEASKDDCDAEGKFERGESKGKLTRTDRSSWNDKSWVVGVTIGAASKAYDWNRLKTERVINDRVGDTPIVLVLAVDEQSFAVFERPVETETFSISDDILSAGGKSYDFAGRDLTAPSQHLKRVTAYQEFWHSWRTFHPDTQKY